MKKEFSIVIIILIIIGTILLVPKTKKTIQVNEQVPLITVNVDGAVMMPGEYQLINGSTIGDLISLAKGLTPNANQSSINFDEIIKAGNYYFEFQEQANLTIKYNLNSVTAIELATISGMTATRITAFLEYRQTVGYIKEVAELLNVKGIGTATYEKIKDFFTV